MQLYLPVAEVSVNALGLLLIGGMVGLLSGLFGVGGGFILTPLLFFIGIPPTVAVASAANQIAGSSFSAFLAHMRRKTVDFRMGSVLLVGGLLGSFLGVRAFEILFQPDSTTPVLRWFLNSMIAATGHALLVCLVCSMAGYALARLRFPGRNVLFGVIISTLFVPGFVFLMPNYEMMSKLTWLDSFLALIVPGAAGAFGVFFMRQFFLGSPSSWRSRPASTEPARGGSSSPSCCPTRRPP